MSYARFSEDSDVYVFNVDSGHLRCHWCALGDSDYEDRTTLGMVIHLRRHVATGHRVPGHCWRGLAEDALSNWWLRMAWNARRLAGLVGGAP